MQIGIFFYYKIDSFFASKKSCELLIPDKNRYIMGFKGVLIQDSIYFQITNVQMVFFKSSFYFCDI